MLLSEIVCVVLLNVPNPCGPPAVALPVPPPAITQSRSTFPSRASAAAASQPSATLNPSNIKFGLFATLGAGPPLGVFSRSGERRIPAPYTTPTSNTNAYCAAKDPSGVSILNGSNLDAQKMFNILSLHASWVRTGPPPFTADLTYLHGPGSYSWGRFDAIACSGFYNHFESVVNITAGPVQLPNHQTIVRYKTPADFANFCAATARHASTIFHLHTYTLPGNEVNGNTQKWPDGEAGIAAFAPPCYRAIKANDPLAFVYGFELNMDPSHFPTAFVHDMLLRGCGPGTCYDGLSAHLSMRYPAPPAGTPCYPNDHGDYVLACLDDLRRAAGRPVLIMIGETAAGWPLEYPDAATAARAAAAEYAAFGRTNYITYVSWNNTDQCSLYPTSPPYNYFSNGCLVDLNNNRTPLWYALYPFYVAGKK